MILADRSFVGTDGRGMPPDHVSYSAPFMRGEDMGGKGGELLGYIIIRCDPLLLVLLPLLSAANGTSRFHASLLLDERIDARDSLSFSRSCACFPFSP